jgi:hypothetical protein
MTMVEAAVVKQPVDERLENMFRQLIDLYARHAEERQVILKEKEELVRLVQLLVSQTKEIGQYENGIRKRIQDCIKESAEIAMQSIEKMLTEKNNNAIEQLIHKFNQNCTAIETIIYRSYSDSEKSLSKWKIIGTAVLSSVITGLLSIWLLIPKPVLPLTSEQIGYLQQGQMLVQMWPKLTKKEQDRLQAVSYKISHSVVR